MEGEERGKVEGRTVAKIGISYTQMGGGVNGKITAAAASVDDCVRLATEEDEMKTGWQELRT